VRIEDDLLVAADAERIKRSAALPSKAEAVERVMAGEVQFPRTFTADAAGFAL
jgi:hypothetical protein